MIAEICNHCGHVGTLCLALTNTLPRTLYFGSSKFKKSSIPKTVTYVVVSEYSQKCIRENSFRSSVTSIRFNGDFHLGDDTDVLPPKLQILDVAGTMTIRHRMLPPTLTSLKMTGTQNNMPIKVGTFPEGLLELSFSISELKPGLLPESLQSLTFGSLFNQEIAPGLLPPSLTLLSLGSMFNQEIAVGVLPASLTSLSFGALFNKPLINQEGVSILPQHLTSLSFVSYNHPLPALPASMTNLDLGNKFKHPMEVPQSLTSLALGPVMYDHALILPTSLTSLKFTQEFNKKVTIGSLPQSLTSVLFGDKFNEPILPGSLPNSITHLTFGHSFYPVIFQDGALPASLTSLIIESSRIDHNMELPDQIKHLSVPYFIPKKCLPRGLKNLTITLAHTPIGTLKTVHLDSLAIQIKTREFSLALWLYRRLNAKIPNVGTYRFQHKREHFADFTRIGNDWLLLTFKWGGVRTFGFHFFVEEPIPKKSYYSGGYYY
ncbi:hypothetical protein SAMD00019534_108640 [Acytostelium subglobosum LB1]|uniref:hypothetical protein n=1 Tax=Acytostelium subglobosum LB1 TaxID=1410327 RepID=UPI000645147A|nr:hypothetical protein SAMD00019534_108640 [Acytostelium subglobosum LB1]GAM27688.1 hypothetical protein SAMD00019534_108640 [Acytostelium subglobosum LB1]|eukprot:XP_012749347.1 hypothetical protein SAMD00019534_108640 [Acytostelium subglobosum LB1]